MKNIKMFTVIIAFSCLYQVACTTGMVSVKEVREVSDFTEISLSISADVYIEQGKEFKVEIEADADDLKKIETELSGSTLRIKTRDWHNNISGNTKIYITMPEIEGLFVAGSGKIINKSSIKSDDLDLNVSGSGSINLNDLIAAKIDATITGSGDVNVRGNEKVGKIYVNITGSGSYNGQDLTASDVNVTITGSGSADVNAADYLNTNITGSGNVNYSGRPRVNANATGSGRTKALN